MPTITIHKSSGVVESGEVKANTNLVGSGNLILTSTDRVGSVEWTCSNSTIPNKWLPAVCR